MTAHTMRFQVALFASLLATSCMTSGVSSKLTYDEPNGLFSIKLPSSLYEPYVETEFNEQSGYGTVAFNPDESTNELVIYMREDLRIREGADDDRTGADFDALLTAMFETYVVSTIFSGSAETEVVLGPEFETSEFGHMLLAVVKIPGAYRWTQDADDRDYGMQGVMLFFRKGHTYIMSRTRLMPASAPPDPEGARKEMLEYYGRFTFHH